IQNQSGITRMRTPQTIRLKTLKHSVVAVTCWRMEEWSNSLNSQSAINPWLSLPAGIKPYYEEDGIVVIHGDCRDILPHLPKVDLVLTDPPYGIAFDTDYRRFTTGFNIERRNHLKIEGDQAPFDPAFLLQYGAKQIIWGVNCF